MTSQKLSRFKSPLQAYCTCPPKYNVNPYLGRCAHGCLYCYAVKFPSFQGPVKPRHNLPASIGRMAEHTSPKLSVMLSDCTDPYQPAEKDYRITRKCVEALTGHGFPLLIVTKSDLVLRDTRLLKQAGAVVSITVTTIRDEVAKTIEPHAPPPSRRLKALEKLAEEGIATTARIDPLIPGLNDSLEDLKQLTTALKEVGVKQVTVSSLKPVRGFFSSLEAVDPQLAHNLRKLYSQGKAILGYRYLPEEVRFRLISKIRDLILTHGLRFASCREACEKLNTAPCDGTAFCASPRRTNLLGWASPRVG
ncbi:SPL family radical SAM protein [Candidatus Hecatella orcuttiae]|uniref:SPL family radical SAM protein n=1 Tax=Candidatus Hecatella orcuttiae TaxID=1935119 RepID=UPI002867CF9A|nr:radical SAM protein [Candidatus Hecatella orcuttiae]